MYITPQASMPSLYPCHWIMSQFPPKKKLSVFSPQISAIICAFMTLAFLDAPVEAVAGRLVGA